MTVIILQFFLCALIVSLAGYFLTKFADKIAEATGWGQMFVGGLLLAAATSLPELMVDLNAVKMQMPNLAVGDLLGSCMINLLILSLLDFTFPSAFRRTAFSPAFLHHSLSAVLGIYLAALVGIGLVSQFRLSFLNLSVISWAILISYIFGFRLIFLEREKKTLDEKKGSILKKIFLPMSGFGIASFVIFLTAPYLVELADEIAKKTALSHSFIGTTLIAFTTSLPELVTTLTAFRMGSPDLALGNIFGSNAFNILLFVPLDMISSTSIFTSVSSSHALSAFGIIASMSMAVLGMSYRKKTRALFADPSSETIVILIIAFLYLLYRIK